MKNLTQEWELFHFTDAEAKVVHSFLENGAQSVSALARSSSLPRSTANDVLKRLNERGLARKVSKGYASIWRLVRPNQINDELKSAAKTFGIENVKEEIEKEIGVRTSDDTEIYVYRGIENILKVYRYLFGNLQREQRIHAIETPAAVKGFMEYVSDKEAVSFNTFLTQQNIIIEAVFPEGIKDAYREFAEQNPAWPESFTPRTQAMRTVPDMYLPGTMELIIFDQRATMADYAEELLILIQNEEMVTSFKALYRLMYEMGKPFDQNEFIRNLIKE